MVREMTSSPKALREPEHQTQVQRVNTIPGAGAKERKMDKVVRHRVRVPPEANSDEGNGGRRQQEPSVRERERDQQSIPFRVSKDWPAHRVLSASLSCFTISA